MRRKSAPGFALRRFPPHPAIDYTYPQPFNDERLSPRGQNSTRTGGQFSMRADTTTISLGARSKPWAILCATSTRYVDMSIGDTGAKRWVLVTGGSRGIGAAMVRRLCAVGYNVAFTYRQSEGEAIALAKALNKDTTCCEAIRCDATDRSSVDTLACQLKACHGTPYAIVHNAGRACVFHTKSATDSNRNPPPIMIQSRPPIPIAKPPPVPTKTRQSGGR